MDDLIERLDRFAGLAFISAEIHQESAAALRAAAEREKAHRVLLIHIIGELCEISNSLGDPYETNYKEDLELMRIEGDRAAAISDRIEREYPGIKDEWWASVLAKHEKPAAS